MDRNFLLAFLLSTAAIFAYYTLFPPPDPVVEQKKEAVEFSTEKERQDTTPTIKPAIVKEAVVEETIETYSEERETIEVENSLYSIKIDTLGGVLTSHLLKNFKHSLEPHINVKDLVVSLFTGEERRVREYDPTRLVNMAGDLSKENRVWKVSTGVERGEFNFTPSQKEIHVGSIPEDLVLKTILPSGLEEWKIITFHPDSYMIDLELRIINRTDKAFDLSPSINFGAGNVAVDGESLPRPKVGISFIDGDFETYDEGDFEAGLGLNKAVWAGVMDTYFVSVVKNKDESEFDSRFVPVDSVLNGKPLKVPRLVYTDTSLTLGPRQEYHRKFTLYLGPKVEAELEKFNRYLPQTLNLGWFEIIARPLLAILRWLQGYVVNWGVAIILLTIIVRLGMFPLAFKGMISMQKMQQLNPKITAIRKKYKGDKERMNKEIMQFYSQHKINPMGGCLPMVFQIPIFIALYQALMPAIELRHRPFALWLNDLSAADYTLVLPILMGITMFLQQSLTPNPAMEATQAKIMKWMPVMMVFFFLSMPSGLVLYWVVSNMISIIQQLFFNKVKAASAQEEVTPPKGKKKSTLKKK